MSKERFRLPLAVFLILEQDGKIWLQRRANTGYRDGEYDLPSGHVDGGEPAHIAMVREAREEVGIEIDPNDLVGVHVLHNNDGMEYIDIFFKAQKWTGEPKNNEPEKCDDAGWFPIGELPQPIIPHVVAVLQEVKAGNVYSTIHW
ncbi:MAG TPA: NUDIX domain-containing protein [Candidatus Paceibacterota bacterium]|nr:NUDIX domain-containing protein [Candidatus Paceibacterota bacterium]